MLRRRRLLSIRPRRCSGRSKFGGFLYLSFLCSMIVDGVSMRRTLCCAWPRPRLPHRGRSKMELAASISLAASFIIFGVLGLDS